MASRPPSANKDEQSHAEHATKGDGRAFDREKTTHPDWVVFTPSALLLAFLVFLKLFVKLFVKRSQRGENKDIFEAPAATPEASHERFDVSSKCARTHSLAMKRASCIGMVKVTTLQNS